MNHNCFICDKPTTKMSVEQFSGTHYYCDEHEDYNPYHPFENFNEWFDSVKHILEVDDLAGGQGSVLVY